MDTRKCMVTAAAVLVLSIAGLTSLLGQGCCDSSWNDDWSDWGSRSGMHGSGMMGPGMMGQCPMCGGPMRGGWNGTIPDKLPQPKDKEWISRLRAILTLEKLSQAQYAADRDKYHVGMPYMMIIPQEVNHIDWIGRLFAAYGLKSDGKTPAVKKSDSITQAYEIGRNLEADLIPKYVWLIQNGEDKTTKQVLDSILVQTRMHHMMFTHALEMGGMGMWR